MKAGGDLPASLPVNSSARPTISMFGGVVWAAEGPLNALHTTRPQALSPLRPWWPSTVNYKCDKTDSSDFTAVCVYTSAVDLTTATHWSSQGWADTSVAFLSRTHKPHSPLWSAGPASSAHPPPHTHTPLVTHTAVCGSSPAPLGTSILKVLIR